MTFKEKKAWLMRYRNAQKRIERLKHELSGVRAIAEKTTPTLSLAAVCGGDSASRQERFVERAEELEEEIQGLVADSNRYEKEIRAAIATIPNKDHVRYLEYYYLDMLTWETISHMVGYVRESIYRICKKEITNLNIKMS